MRDASVREPGVESYSPLASRPIVTERPPSASLDLDRVVDRPGVRELAAECGFPVAHADLRGAFEEDRRLCIHLELDRVTEALDKAEARTQRRLNKARLHVRDELLRIDAQNNAAINELYGSRGILQHYLNA